MVVKFNKFDQCETPSLMLCYPGSTYVNGSVTYPVGIMPFCSDIEFIFNFNDVSELNFRVNMVHEQSEYYARAMRTYSRVLKNMYIFVDDIGFFRIENVDEIATEYENYKDVSASSCEVEIASRGMPFIEDGQYRITDIIYTKIRPLVPQWNMTPYDMDIDPSLLDLTRTFTSVDLQQNIFDFMINEMQEIYGCVFIFDIINRHVSVFAKENYINKTSIHLTTGDILSLVKTTASGDGVYSAMTGRGIDDITFSAVNPLGGNTVYDFSYYIDWMPKELARKVEEWSDAVSGVETEYYYARIDYTVAYNRWAGAEAEIDRLNTIISVYSRCRENIRTYQTTVNVDLYNASIQSDGDKIPNETDVASVLDSIKDLIDDASAKIDVQRDLASEQQLIMQEKESVMSEINTSLSFETYFTPIEYSVLSNFIFQGTYSDELIGFTSNTHDVSKLHIMRMLYEKTKQILTRVSSAILDFELSTDNFIFLSKFGAWTDQLKTGSTINIEMRDGYVEQPFVTSITINYEDRSSSIGVSGALRNNNNRSLFKSVFEGISKTNSTIAHI